MCFLFFFFFCVVALGRWLALLQYRVVMLWRMTKDGRSEADLSHHVVELELFVVVSLLVVREAEGRGILDARLSHSSNQTKGTTRSLGISCSSVHFPFIV